jgi:toxin ParE1/3/4
MRSSHRLRLTKEARDDLRDLLQYSYEAWGSEQRDAYRTRIQRALLTLSRHPDLGRPRDDLIPNLRSYVIGVHIIFYLVIGNEVRTLRILHSSRDTQPLFGDTPPEPS